MSAEAARIECGCLSVLYNSTCTYVYFGRHKCEEVTKKKQKTKITRESSEVAFDISGGGAAGVSVWCLVFGAVAVINRTSLS